MKRILLTLLLLLGLTEQAEAALRYLVPDGISGACTNIWTDTKCWSLLTYTGNPATTTNGAAAPTSAEDILLDVNSGAIVMSLNGAGRAGLSITMTGFTGTLALGTQQLTITNNVTLCAACTITGTGILSISSTSTMTSAAKTWPGALALPNTITYTMADDWIVTGACSFGSAGSPTLNGAFTLTCGDNVTLAAAATVLQGTASVKMTCADGTATLSHTGSVTGSLRNNFEIACGAGTATINTTIRYLTGIFKYTSGTLSTSGWVMVLPGAATITANAAGLTIPTLQITVGNQVFNGTSGFNIGSFSCLIAGITVTMTSTNTYGVTTSLINTATSASHNVFIASTGSSAVNLNYTGSTMAMAYVDATDITSSTAMYTYGGTLTRTSLWATGTQIGAYTVPGGGIIQ